MTHRPTRVVTANMVGRVVLLENNTKILTYRHADTGSRVNHCPNPSSWHGSCPLTRAPVSALCFTNYADTTSVTLTRPVSAPACRERHMFDFLDFRFSKPVLNYVLPLKWSDNIITLILEFNSPYTLTLTSFPPTWYWDFESVTIMPTQTIQQQPISPDQNQNVNQSSIQQTQI